MLATVNQNLKQITNKMIVDIQKAKKLITQGKPVYAVFQCTGANNLGNNKWKEVKWEAKQRVIRMHLPINSYNNQGVSIK